MADGRGEAGDDLLPGSVFLRRLNTRPLAAHTHHTIIAGRLSPIGESELRGLAEKIRKLAGREGAPSWLREAAESPGAGPAISVLAAAVNGLGDGLVTIESARLDGVEDFLVIEANHQSLIVNMFQSDRTPPAIPIILDRLGTAPAPQPYNSGDMGTRASPVRPREPG